MLIITSNYSFYPYDLIQFKTLFFFYLFVGFSASCISIVPNLSVYIIFFNPKRRAGFCVGRNLFTSKELLKDKNTRMKLTIRFHKTSDFLRQLVENQLQISSFSKLLQFFNCPLSTNGLHFSLELILN